MKYARVILGLALLAPLASPAQAQVTDRVISADTTADVATNAQVIIDLNRDMLPDPGTLPGEGTYQLELLFESMGDMFATGDQQILRNVSLAEERMAEALALPEDKTPLRAAALERSQKRIAAAQDKYDCHQSEVGAATRVFLAGKIGQAVNNGVQTFAIVYNDTPAEGRQDLQPLFNDTDAGVLRLQSDYAGLDVEIPEASNNLRAALTAQSPATLRTQVDSMRDTLATGNGLDLDIQANINLDANTDRDENNGLNLDGNLEIDGNTQGNDNGSLIDIEADVNSDANGTTNGSGSLLDVEANVDANGSSASGNNTNGLLDADLNLR